MKANEILKKHEDANEMHFHEVDRKWIIEAMEEYAALRQPIVSGSLPPNVDLDAARKLRGYFGKNDASVFEHWAYSYFDRIVKQLEKSGGNDR